MDARPPHSTTGAPRGARRFGAFDGVFVPSLLSILGIVLYLRVGWVVGELGLGGALAVLFGAHLISVLTGLSVASLATSRATGVGGAYYLVSHALGPPAGAAVGIPLYLAQTVSIAFYVTGLSEVAGHLYPGLDPRLTGSLAMLLLALLTLPGARLTLRAQYLVLALIALSLLSLFLGSGPAPGVGGPEGPRPPVAPSEVFAVFFPAVTGIMAGIGMSGDLRDPRRDLPRGVLAAILVGFLVYLGVMLLLAARADPSWLRNDLSVEWRLARFPELVSAGVIAAALSSGLGSLLAAPRTLQALARDGHLPRVLGRGQGPAREPRLALLLTLGLAEMAVLLGGLNQVALLLTLFFLVTYGVTNLACALESWAASPGFRPNFRLPWWLSGLGAVACVVAMWVIDPLFTLIALGLTTAVYALAARRTLRRRFGDDRFGLWSALARAALYNLQRTPYSPLDWRPNLIVFSAATPRRSYLLGLAAPMVSESGVVTLFHLLTGEVEGQAAEARRLQGRLEAALAEGHPDVFCRVAVVARLFPGMVDVVQSYGVGRFAANTVMLGWPARRRHWRAYLKSCRALLRLQRALLIAHHRGDTLPDRPASIDLWWRGQPDCLAMMLLLAYLLTTHWLDPGVGVRLLGAARTQEGRHRLRKDLQAWAQQARIPVAVTVVGTSAQGFDEVVLAHSEATDLTLLPLHLPADPVQEMDTMARHQQLVERLPATLLVASPRGFEGRSLLLDEDDE